MAALFPRITTWVSNQILTASALNGEFNNILNNMQMSSIVGYSASVSQMQQQTSPGGVGSESLSGSSSDESQRVRFMLAYILGKTYWYDQTGSNLGPLGIKAGSFAAGAIKTADIAANAITPANLSVFNYNITPTANLVTQSYQYVNPGTFQVVTTLNLTVSGVRPVYVLAFGNNLYQTGARNGAGNAATFNVSLNISNWTIAGASFTTLPVFDTFQTTVGGTGTYSSNGDVALNGATGSTTRTSWSGTWAPTNVHGVFVPPNGTTTTTLTATLQVNPGSLNYGGTSGVTNVGLFMWEG